MGGSSSESEGTSGNLHLAFKRMEVNYKDMKNRGAEDSSSEEEGTEWKEHLQCLWNEKEDAVASCRKETPNLKGARRHRKMSTRMEPYPQDMIFSMQKMTFHQEECTNNLCTCKSPASKPSKHNKYNYANVAGTSGLPKCLIRESRLKLHHSEKDRKHVIRAARLKLVKHSHKSDSSVVLGTEPKFSPGATCLSSPTTNQHIFGQQCSKHLENFTSCTTTGTDSKPSDDVLPSASRFSHRNNQEKKRHARSKTEPSLSLLDNLTLNDDSQSNTNSTDQVLERSCSQEARLDDMTVTELACYFEDFVHIPKKMSSMAEMMYI